MRKCFISLLPDAPDGFEYRKPEKRDLLGSTLAIWAESLESVQPVIQKYKDRILGLIITVGETFSFTQFQHEIYHLSVPKSTLDLYHLVSSFLDSISDGQKARDENQNLRIQLEQSLRQQKEIKLSFESFSKRLTDKVNELNDEIERRIQVEASLRQQQELMDLTLTASSIGLGMAKNRKIVWANEAMERLFGRSKDELKGEDTKILYPNEKEYQRVGKILYERADSQSVVELDAEFIRKDGALFYGQYRVVFKNPKDPDEGLVVSLIDITERKKAEQALRISEKRYRDLTEMVPEVIFETDDKMLLTFVNKHAFNLFGYTTEDFEKGLNGINMIAPLDRKNAHENMMRRVKGENLGSVEYMAIKKDGTEFPVLFHATTIMEGGKFIGVKGIIVDITERKQIEDQLQRELLQKEILLREIHHRVKNNMNVIMSLLNLQSHKIQNKSQALFAFEESKNRILSMALVHEQLYQNDDLAKVDIQSYIEKLSRKLKMIYASDKLITLHLDVTNVFLDVNHAIPCGLILNELISNAFKHAFNKKKRGDIYVSFCQDEDNSFIMKVKDNGVGLNDSLDIQKSNTLGLQLVRILTEQLNAELSINKRNLTTFSIRFRTT